YAAIRQLYRTVPDGATLIRPTTSHRHQNLILARQLLNIIKRLHTPYRRNQVAPQHSIGSTIIVQTAIFASERCGALRKNKQYRSKIFTTSHTKC
ncbi:TPA: hypothetical protein ACF5K2_001929, partial [Salmonella enterica]